MDDKPDRPPFVEEGGFFLLNKWVGVTRTLTFAGFCLVFVPWFLVPRYRLSYTLTELLLAVGILGITDTVVFNLVHVQGVQAVVLFYAVFHTLAMAFVGALYHAPWRVVPGPTAPRARLILITIYSLLPIFLWFWIAFVIYCARH